MSFGRSKKKIEETGNVPATLDIVKSFEFQNPKAFISWRHQAFIPAASGHSVEIFASSIAKKKDTGASSYKVDSNMGIPFFWVTSDFYQPNISDISFQSAPRNTLRHTWTKSWIIDVAQASILFWPLPNCRKQRYMYIYIYVYPFHHTVSVAHSCTLWLWVSQTTIFWESQQSKPTHCVSAQDGMAACLGDRVCPQRMAMPRHKAQAIHGETQT